MCATAISSELEPILEKRRHFASDLDTVYDILLEGEKKQTYLRGEACQTIYLNYENVRNTMRAKIPFGIIQIGKAFRNEITPKQFLFRQREFEQWDLQWL